MNVTRLSRFVSEVVAKRRVADHSSSQDVPPTVVMKMDIEGKGDFYIYSMPNQYWHH